MADQEPESRSAPETTAGTGDATGTEGDASETGAGAGAGKQQPPAKHEDPGPGPGVDAVGWFGVFGTGLFIVAAIVAVILGLVELVPDLVPTPDRGATNVGSTDAGSTDGGSTDGGSTSGGSTNGGSTGEGDLLLAVALAGALGGLIHSARSFYWYVGNRELRRSWLMMYYLRPLAGAALAAVFYLVIRGGFIPENQSGNSLAFMALAALVGLFSEEAVLKLKEVAENIFKKAPQGKDAEPQVKPADAAAAEDSAG